MVCPKCKEENKKSTLYPGMTTCTLAGHIPYYDEDGKYHDHDPNTRTTSYSCSNGHSFSYSKKNECVNCDYGKNSEKIRMEEGNFNQGNSITINLDGNGATGTIVTGGGLNGITLGGFAGDGGTTFTAGGTSTTNI